MYVLGFLIADLYLGIWPRLSVFLFRLDDVCVFDVTAAEQFDEGVFQ